MARILVFSPHPDDEAIGCGGTLLGHAEAGDEIRVIHFTSGERGSRVMETHETAAVREQEARAAADRLGVRELEFWREPDGALRATAALIARTAQALRDHAPDCLYTTHGAELHQDHRVAMRIVMRALATGSGWPLVRLFEVWTPLQRCNRINDISGHIDAKMEAIRCYPSQCANRPFDEAAAALNRYRATMHGTGQYGEAFVEIRSPPGQRAVSQVPEQASGDAEQPGLPDVWKA